MSLGFYVLFAMLVVLVAIGLTRRDDTFQRALKRWIEQFAMLVPRMFCALLAAGFIGKLIPSAYISQFLGAEAGIMALVFAAAAGLVIPAGPVIAFAIAAIFIQSEASVAAVITFISSWSLYAAHRIFMFELPLLGASFLRLRVLSVAVIPLGAGLLAMALGMIAGGQFPGAG